MRMWWLFLRINMKMWRPGWQVVIKMEEGQSWFSVELVERYGNLAQEVEERVTVRGKSSDEVKGENKQVTALAADVSTMKIWENEAFGGCGMAAE